MVRIDEGLNGEPLEVVNCFTYLGSQVIADGGWELNWDTMNIIIIIIYHDFLPTPRRGSHVKSGKTHTQSSRYTP